MVEEVRIREHLTLLRRVILWSVSTVTVLLLVLVILLPVDERVLAPGTVRATYDSHLYSPRSGFLKRAAADEGMAVRKGDAVIELESDELHNELRQIEARVSQARGDLEFQRARLERTARLPLPEGLRHMQEEVRIAAQRVAQAEAEFQRAESLHARGLASQQDLERARLAMEIAKAERDKTMENSQVVTGGLGESILDEMRAQVRAAEAALAALEVERTVCADKIEKSILRAPADGTVTWLKTRRPGSPVSEGEDLAHLAHGDADRIEIAAGQSQFHRLRPGQKVLMKSMSFDVLRHGYIEGTVTEVALEAEQGDAGSPSYRVRARVDRTPLPLALGSTVEARIIIRRVPLWTLLLPETMRPD